jgi:hypothetical protein
MEGESVRLREEKRNREFLLPVSTRSLFFGSKDARLSGYPE